MSLIIIAGAFVSFIILGLLIGWVVSFVLCFIVGILIVIIYYVLSVIDGRKLIKLKEGYTNEKDESGKSECFSRSFERRTNKEPYEPVNIEGQPLQSSERILLQGDDVISSGKDERQSVGTKKHAGKLFKRRRNRR